MAVSKNAAGYSGLTEDEEKQLKALLNKAQQAPKASGGSAMTDASKRLRGVSDSDFEAVVSPTTPIELFRSEDRKEVPLPRISSGLTRFASFRKSMVSQSGTECLILNCLGWLLTVTLSWTSIWDSFSRSIMGPMMELTSLKPWTWLGFFSIWSLILRESQLVLGRKRLSHDLNVTPVIDTCALRF